MAANVEMESSGSEFSDFSIASYEIDDDTPPESPNEHLQNTDTSYTGVIRGYMFEPEAEETEQNVNNDLESTEHGEPVDSRTDAEVSEWLACFTLFLESMMVDGFI